MKLLFLDTKPIRRGAQVFVDDLSQHFHEEGIEIKKVYLYAYHESVKLNLLNQDTELNGNEKHIFEKIPTIHPVLLLRLIKTINAWNPDFVLLNGSRTLKYGAAAKPFLYKNTKLIYRIIDSPKFWNRSVLKQFYYRKLILSNIDAAVGVSQASLNDMVALHGYNKPTTVIHRAIQENKFKNVASKENCRLKFSTKSTDKVLLFLGNLTPQKRPDRFVEIIKLVKQDFPEIKAWIVGDGVLRQETEALVLKYDLQNNIKFWGYQQNVTELISASDLLVLSSDTEGLPGVVLECGYLGVPAVSANVGGINECLDNGKTGYVVQTQNPEEYANYITELLDNEEKRKSMGVLSMQKVKSGFTMDTVAEKYLEFFHSLK
jgi:glycosyltransferase involved in cell wall biosynthesis